MTGQKTDELIIVVDALTILLRAHDAENWADWMEQSSHRLKNADYAGIEKLLAAYGGMGSFNDLVLMTTPEEMNRLDALRRQAWQLAIEIKQDQ